jgi:RNA polymerase sigma-70 factor (ECF subfamily)
VEDFAALADSALLAATASRPEAFGEFYARHEDAVLFFFLRRGATADLAADLTAETFAAALGTAARFRDDGPPAIAWLYGIARNVLAMSRRRGAVEARARKRLGMEPVALTDSALEALEQFGSEDALAVLGELPAPQRAAIEAHVIDRETYPAIAASLECSEMVVRPRVSRGLRELRARLEEDS